LNLTDSFTRQCLGQEVDTSLSGKRVVGFDTLKWPTNDTLIWPT